LRNNILFIILISCLLALTSCRLGPPLRDSEILTAASSVYQDTLVAPKDTISIVAVGDISFRKVRQFLKGDVVFGNLEGCFIDTGKSEKCKDTLKASCYAFRMPVRYAGIIKNAGFNLLSIANNHIGDFEDPGRLRTMNVLDSLEINYAGLQSQPYSILEKDGVRYAFSAFAPNQNTLQITDIEKARALVSKLKQLAHIVIVSFHGGAEGALHEHVPRTDEIYLTENRGNVYLFAHSMIDAGADVVLGHGPHVTRAVEIYKNKFIAYSLGNFCTYGMFNLKGPNGIAPLLQLKVNSKGDFLFADVISVKQDKINRLTLDPAQAAFKKLKYLTDSDFPGHDLTFSKEGRIRKKSN
jgi:poly-gamma-glutamate capsule biosynthesis protein CapA/YwtB (metallophosphatase superfamily)